jgi:hypothetical protein
MTQADNSGFSITKLLTADKETISIIASFKDHGKWANFVATPYLTDLLKGMEAEFKGPDRVGLEFDNPMTIPDLEVELRSVLHMMFGFDPKLFGKGIIIQDLSHNEIYLVANKENNNDGKNEPFRVQRIGGTND